MNFQNVNPLNVRLNKISGNLLPMTSDDRLFPLMWRIYSAAVTLLEVIQISAMIPGMLSVPTMKAVQDGTVPSVVLTEVTILFIRMQMHRGLICRLVGKLDDIMLVEDKARMERIVKSTMRSVETPLKYYWVIGCISITLWIAVSFFMVVFKKDYFFYEDYRVPVVISKQPFSMVILALGDILGCLCTIYMFLRKNGLDLYMINILLLMIAQYRYMAMKLAILFREGIPQSQSGIKTRKGYSDVNLRAEKEIKLLCRRHCALIQITPMLKKLFSMNTTLMYLSNVFRFCFLCCLTIAAIPAYPLLEITAILLYTIGGMVHLYVLCSCVHDLLEVSTEITNEAFHEKWYQFEPPLKRTFLLMIMSNNLECKLSAFEAFSLTLPSFMTIMNQAYSIALLIMRVNK